MSALIAVAESGSVTRAADILHLVQPAVSRQIRLLEDELGTALFERTRSGMVLTSDGRVLLEHARRALGELERARAEIRPRSGELQGLVTVGLLPSFADPLAEALVGRVAREHPTVQLRLLVGYAGHVAEWLDAADVDLAVLYDVRPSASVDVRPLLDEALWVVGPPDADLSLEHPMGLAEVVDRLRVLPSRPHAMRNMLERTAARKGCELRVAVETNSMSVQRRLAAAGVGLTVLPGTAVTNALARGRVTAAPLTDPEMRRRLVLAMPGTRKLSVAARGVADLLVDEMARSVASGAWPSATWLGG
ncbi:LysR family transcriptional regulator [Pseudonocardia sp. T1-2H]|uniref:LysR family transcriptional regulator n=1 Tax=Pseudonocardia sp. T1-2H TaxID=3128899 RepID=UPI003100DE60